MIKKILVGIDTSEHSRNAQAYAFYFAWLFNATLIGLHVVDIVSIEGSFFHDISGSLGLEPYLDFSSKMREVLTARGRGVLDEFAASARRVPKMSIYFAMPAWGARTPHPRTRGSCNFL